MKSINEQLNIPLIEGGANVYQPSIYLNTSDPSERPYNFKIVQGNTYSNAIGNFEFCVTKCQTLHPFNKSKRNACINECKSKYDVNSLVDLVKHETGQNVAPYLPPSLGGTKEIQPQPSASSENELNMLKSKNNTLYIVGGVLALGAIVGAYFLFKKKTN